MQRNGKKITTNVLVRAAFLTALSIVLTRFLSIILPIAGGNTVRVGFGGIPVTISGVLFGPVVGGITGMASDLIGILINPMGSFHPGFTLSSTLNGVLPGLLSIYYRKRPKDGSYITLPRILLIETITGLVISIGLNTLWLTQMYGMGILASLPFRIFNTIINIAVGTIVTFNILKIFKKETRI